MTPMRASSTRTSTTASTSEKAVAGWRRRGALAALLIPLALPLIRPALAANSGAEAFVAAVGDNVVGILRDEQTSQDEKLAALKDLLDANTDLELVARLVLGRHWRPRARRSATTMWSSSARS